jgi:acetolactate synthase-1/2/3 large subunit
MQKGFFKGHMIGESAKSGVGFPDFVKVAKAYGIRTFRITNHRQLGKTIPRVLETEGPVLCDIIMDPDCFVTPRVISKQLPDGRMVSSPLEEMYPFLEEDEFLSNMIIPRWQAG